MKIGFTGTRLGMTPAQRGRVRELLMKYIPTAVHHGDCVGADADFHDLSKKYLLKIIVHPPEDESKRAFCTGAAEYKEPLPYLKRNHRIVDASDVMIACPKGTTEEKRSGTWATIRYARSKGCKVYVVGPVGNILE